MIDPHEEEFGATQEDIDYTCEVLDFLVEALGIEKAYTMLSAEVPGVGEVREWPKGGER